MLGSLILAVAMTGQIGGMMPVSQGPDGQAWVRGWKGEYIHLYPDGVNPFTGLRYQDATRVASAAAVGSLGSFSDAYARDRRPGASVKGLAGNIGPAKPHVASKKGGRARHNRVARIPR